MAALIERCGPCKLRPHRLPPFQSLVPADKYAGKTHTYAEWADRQYRDQDFYEGMLVTWRKTPYVLPNRTQFRSMATATTKPTPCPKRELTFTRTQKMPGECWGTPATSCQIGMRLRQVEGSVCSGCYALDGHYRWHNVEALRREHLRQMRDADWVARMVEKIRTEKVEWFRWTDSGDLLDVQMLERIVAIAAGCPQCRFWLPTRELAIVAAYVRKHRPGLPTDKVWPANLAVRLSATMINGPAPVAFARRYGCTVSRVLSTTDYSCSAPANDGRCGDCRACWQREVFEVSYHLLGRGRGTNAPDAGAS
jgi:hypothetical protein